MTEDLLQGSSVVELFKRNDKVTLSSTPAGERVAQFVPTTDKQEK